MQHQSQRVHSQVWISSHETAVRQVSHWRQRDIFRVLVGRQMDEDEFQMHAAWVSDGRDLTRPAVQYSLNQGPDSTLAWYMGDAGYRGRL